MSKNFNFRKSNADIGAYVEAVYKPRDTISEGLLAASKHAGLMPIHIGPMDARHIEVITRISGAKRAVDIGTLGGYSALAIARGMGAGGKVYSFELEDSTAKVARAALQKAGVGSQVQIFVGPALDNLAKIESLGPFDLLMMDADKVGYKSYLDWADKHLRVGGVVLADNVFGFGYIAQATIPDEDRVSVLSLREFNEKLADHPNFRATVLPTGEGLALAVKVR